MANEELKDAIVKNEVYISKITHSILFTNDITVSYCLDALSKLKRSKYYVRDIKRMANKAEAEMVAYEKRLGRMLFASSNLFADANEKFLSFVDNDLKKLYYCIKFEYDKLKIADSELFSLLRMASELCNLSDAQTDVRVQEFGIIDARFKRMDYSHLSLKKLRKAMSCLLDKMPKVDIESSQSVNLAFDIFLKKIADDKLLFDAIDY